MKKTTVKSHFRRINGKIVPVRRHKRKLAKQVYVGAKPRRILNEISNPDKHDIEYGGAIDFKLDGKMERMEVRPGTKFSVDLPTDYEVLYHTHPDKKESPPSPSDLLNLIEEKDQKVEMIVRDGNIFSIIMTKKAEDKIKDYTEGQRQQLVYELLGGDISEKEAKKNLRDFGFKVMTRSKSDRGFKLDVEPNE